MIRNLSDDLEDEHAVGNYYYHTNLSKKVLDPHRILVYKIRSISNNLVKAEVYDRNGIKHNNVSETDFKFDKNESTIDLSRCLKDIRADNFRIRRFSYR